MRTRLRSIVILGLALLVAVGVGPAASAATVNQTVRWRNCDDKTAGYFLKVTFADPAARYGTGKFMVKREIRWDYLKASGEWRNADRSYTESLWVQITNTAYDWTTSAGDRTNWAALYESPWRVHVTIKLIKNRPGPRDKRVEMIELWPGKGTFTEKGSNCGVDF